MKTQAKKDAIAKAQRELDNVREAYIQGAVDRNCLEVYAKRLWDAKFPPRQAASKAA